MAQRIVELVVSRRNARILLARGARREPKDAFLAIAAVHAALFVALPLEWMQAPWSALGPHTPVALAVALLAMGLRYWAAVSLGVHYTVRVMGFAGAPLVRRGPYRWMRHPIYRAVAIELLAIPLAFGAVATALGLLALNGLALARRIRVEERFLQAG